jgi:hypothetical protein
MFGIPRRNEFIAVHEWDKGVIAAVQAMRKVGMKPNTFYRRVAEIEAQQSNSIN